MNITKTQQIVKQANTQTEEKKEPAERVLILKLEQKPKQRVSWTQETVDNEGMNRKKSNLCCIYHRPGDESSDTCTSDDEGNALERDRHTKHLHKKKCSKLNRKKENKAEEQQQPNSKEEV